MRITARLTETFVPEIDENLALPANERITITYDKPKATQRTQWRRIVAGQDAKGGIETWTDVDIRRVILDSNVKIANFTAVVDGHEQAIGTGKDLVDLRSRFASGLAEMLAYRILRRDYEDELGN